METGGSLVATALVYNAEKVDGNGLGTEPGQEGGGWCRWKDCKLPKVKLGEKTREGGRGKCDKSTRVMHTAYTHGSLRGKRGGGGHRLRLQVVSRTQRHAKLGCLEIPQSLDKEK